MFDAESNGEIRVHDRVRVQEEGGVKETSSEKELTKRAK